ncbi:MAG: hypothetical protein CR972_05100 [Candidatus Moraniibacteriota bacterium]|nr:MAG: hypothetical protein CR972_05100 [Candidatus Moranbacteria bacterium]
MTYEMKKNIISTGFAIGCLVLYFLFPVGNLKFQIFFSIITFLCFLPLLYTKIILKENAQFLGFLPFSTFNLRSLFFLISSIILGGLFAFFVVTLEWGVQKYLDVLSATILYNFGAFLIYQFVFVAPMVFLVTFFSWGFVYAIKWEREIYTFLIALVSYMILLYSFYSSLWIILPFLVPTFFVQKIRDGKNILYMSGAVFVIALIIDTLVVKAFS